jgi:hypothetical protein
MQVIVIPADMHSTRRQTDDEEPVTLDQIIGTAVVLACEVEVIDPTLLRWHGNAAAGSEGVVAQLPAFKTATEYGEDSAGILRDYREWSQKSQQAQRTRTRSRVNSHKVDEGPTRPFYLPMAKLHVVQQLEGAMNYYTTRGLPWRLELSEHLFSSDSARKLQLRVTRRGTAFVCDGDEVVHGFSLSAAASIDAVYGDSSWAPLPDVIAIDACHVEMQSTGGVFDVQTRPLFVARVPMQSTQLLEQLCLFHCPKATQRSVSRYRECAALTMIQRQMYRTVVTTASTAEEVLADAEREKMAQFARMQSMSFAGSFAGGSFGGGGALAAASAAAASTAVNDAPRRAVNEDFDSDDDDKHAEASENPAAVPSAEEPPAAFDEAATSGGARIVLNPFRAGFIHAPPQRPSALTTDSGLLALDHDNRPMDDAGGGGELTPEETAARQQFPVPSARMLDPAAALPWLKEFPVDMSPAAMARRQRPGLFGNPLSEAAQYASPAAVRMRDRIHGRALSRLEESLSSPQDAQAALRAPLPLDTAPRLERAQGVSVAHFGRAASHFASPTLTLDVGELPDDVLSAARGGRYHDTTVRDTAVDMSVSDAALTSVMERPALTAFQAFASKDATRIEPAQLIALLDDCDVQRRLRHAHDDAKLTQSLRAAKSALNFIQRR